jgi:transcription elongation factor GreA
LKNDGKNYQIRLNIKKEAVMAENKTYPMTIEGKQRLEEKLNEMITVERPKITAAIQEARSHGDLSENSEYQSAKDEQAFAEGRISELQNILDNVTLIDPASEPADQITLGKKVTFQEDDDEPETYYIFGAEEIRFNIDENKDQYVSNESPMGSALLGHKIGDLVTIKVPDAGISYEVKIVNVELV